MHQYNVTEVMQRVERPGTANPIVWIARFDLIPYRIAPTLAGDKWQCDYINFLYWETHPDSPIFSSPEEGVAWYDAHIRKVASE